MCFFDVFMALFGWQDTGRTPLHEAILTGGCEDVAMKLLSYSNHNLFLVDKVRQVF
jgi:hypothetical protein